VFILKYNVSLSQLYKIPDVEFMQSLTDGNVIAKYIVEELLSENIKMFREHYNAKKPSKMHYYDAPLIPKIMHHIWFNGEIPPLYQNYLNECKKLHPDWEFKIWNEKNIKELSLENQDLYDKTRNYAGRSDIVRYEILYRFGGVYRDMDVKCFNPIDDLNHKYNFFISIDPPSELFEGNFFKTKSSHSFIPLNNGIIGTSPKHPILKTTLDIIRRDFDNLMDKFDNVPSKYIHDTDSIHAFAVKSTMMPITASFIQHASLDDKNIALPPTYFFSLLDRHYAWPKSWRGRIKGLIPDFFPLAFHYLRPESLMFHNIKHFKREMDYVKFNDGNFMGSKQIKKFVKQLEPSMIVRMRLFKDVYDEKVTSGQIILNKKSRTPQIIHFVIFNEQELSVLEKNLPTWKMLNGDFDIQIWDKEKIKGNFEDVELNLSTPENMRFYLGLRILEKLGGTYANYKAKPYQPIFELNNQFNFYAGLMPIVQEKQKVILSRKMLGTSKEHPIISKALKQITLKDNTSLDNLDEILVSETYKGIYFDGKNVVLPATYFEPVDKYNNSWSSEIKRRWKNRANNFAYYVKYIVVE